jgi:hypothetical protein
VQATLSSAAKNRTTRAMSSGTMLLRASAPLQSTVRAILAQSIVKRLHYDFEIVESKLGKCAGG